MSDPSKWTPGEVSADLSGIPVEFFEPWRLLKGKPKSKSGEPKNTKGPGGVEELALRYAKAIREQNPDEIRSILKDSNTGQLAQAQAYAAKNGLVTEQEAQAAYKAIQPGISDKPLGYSLTENQDMPSPRASDNPAAGFSYDMDENGRGTTPPVNIAPNILSAQLIEMGFMREGEDVTAAIKRQQKIAGLPATGKLDQATAEWLGIKPGKQAPSAAGVFD